MTSTGPNRGGSGERLLSFFWRKPPDTLAERTRRRVVLRLIPYLFFLYILAYLDRVNVAAAEQTMCEPPSAGGLGFDTGIIGFGGGLFFLGYWILEIPSTVTVVHWGARWVFIRILVLWGLCAALVGLIGLPFVTRLFDWLPILPEESSLRFLSATAHYVNHLRDSSVYQFYFFRFLLGFFEGGFFPSVIVYLSYWFRAEDRAKAIAAFMAAIPLSSMIGLPVSRLLLDVHWYGLEGWRWIFIVEGIPPILAGFTTLFLLPDRPAKAAWLSAEERDWIARELDQEHQAKQKLGHAARGQYLGTVLLLTVVYFCINTPSYGLTLFMPRIMREQSGVSIETANLLATPCYVLAFLAMLVVGWHSDRTGERIGHTAVPLTLLGIGMALVAVSSNVPYLPIVLIIFWVGTFMYAHLPAFWPIPTMFLGATAAAAAIGFINMIGNLGGFLGPYLVGWLLKKWGGSAPVLLLLALFPLAAAGLIVLVAYTRPRVRAADGQQPAMPPSPK